jgi:4-amino-4-deoxy-L-arabinose transferase and related glycosyltransferases of PMT family
MYALTLLQRARLGLIGLILVCLAQVILIQERSIAPSWLGPLASAWQELFRIDLAFPDNLLMALGCVGLGCLALWKSLAYLRPPAAQALPELQETSWPWKSTLIGALAWLLSLGVLLAYGYRLWLSLLLCGAIACVWWACWRYDRRRKVPFGGLFQAIDLLWMSCLMLIGLAIACYRLTSLPGSIIPDEWNFWQLAHALTTGEYRIEPFDFGVFSYPMLSSIYQSWFLKLFGPSLWSWRFSSVIASLLAIPPSYLLALYFFQRRIALASGLILISMPLFLSFARLGYNNAQTLAPVVGTLYLLAIGQERRSAVLLLGAGIVAGLGFYTYTAARLGLLVGLVWLGCLWFQKGEDRAWLKRAAFGYLCGWMLVALPHLLYGLTVDSQLHSYKLWESFFANSFYASNFFSEQELYRDFPPLQFGEQTLFVRADLYARLLGRGLFRSLLAFQHPRMLDSHFLVGSLPGPLLALPFLYGCLVLLRNWRLKGAKLFVLWIMLGTLLLSVIDTYPPRPTHLVAITPALAIVSALGLVQLCRLLSQLFEPAWRRRAEVGLLFSSLCAAVSAGALAYLVVMPRHTSATLEDLMTVHILNLKAPERVLFVTSDVEQRYFEPLAAREIPNKATTLTVLLGSIDEEITQIKPDEGLSVFTLPRDRAATEAWLASRLDDLPQPESFRIEEQEQVLYYYIPSPHLRQ